MQQDGVGNVLRVCFADFFCDRHRDLLFIGVATGRANPSILVGAGDLFKDVEKFWTGCLGGDGVIEENT